MKKALLISAIVAVAVAATACSPKKAEETTAATTAEVTTQATTEATTKETTEEEVEEEFMTGIITKINDKILTVKNDDDETEKEYDLTKAEVVQDFPFSEGDWIEISFPEGTTETPVPAIHVEVMESVIGANSDPSLEGIIEDATMNTVTIKMEDGSYTFNTANAYIVAKNGVTVDKKATITYIGDPEDTDPIPLAVKVVLEDSYDSKEADKFAFTGLVVQLEDNSIVLESADGDFYTFYSDTLDFSSYKKGDNVQITYTGTITTKEIPAESISKK